MNMKSILLGSAAGLMVASAASAADLPGEAVPAAVDYVKVCDAFGAGFFYIPGTETCLDISGEVKVSAKYTEAGDTTTIKAGGNVSFDARTATELGTLRSFFKFTSGNDAGDAGANDILLDAAFIQLHYFVIGRTGSIFNKDTLYGEFSADSNFIADDAIVAQVIVDDLGGGFYVKAGVEADEKGIYEIVNPNDPDLALSFGIAGQPWGSIDASFIYSMDTTDWDAKLTADLSVAENLSARLAVAYFDNFTPGNNDFRLSGAVKYSAGAFTPYAGVAYTFDAEELDANIGFDYAVVDGLTATAELGYEDTAAGDNFSIYAALKRTW